MTTRALLALAALSLVAAASDDRRYGDTLLTQAANRAGSALRIDARGKDGGIIVIGPVIESGAVVPLDDAMGRPIGTLTVPARLRSRARAAAAWLARRIYVADNLVEADPFVAGAVRHRRAQALVERSLARFPDVVTLALHVAPQLAGNNTIIASSFGRIGKAGDPDDLHVERDGAVLREVTNDGRRLAVELPLLDQAGHSIGALSTSFAVPAGVDPQRLYPRAVAVRDDMARHIPSRAALFAR